MDNGQFNEWCCQIIARLLRSSGRGEAAGALAEVHSEAGWHSLRGDSPCTRPGSGAATSASRFVLQTHWAPAQYSFRARPEVMECSELNKAELRWCCSLTPASSGSCFPTECAWAGAVSRQIPFLLLFITDGAVVEGRFLPSFLSLPQFQMLWVIAAFSGLELLCWERYKEMQ